MSPPEKRFERLEAENRLPESLKAAVAKLDRFGRLEIGEIGGSRVDSAAAAAPADRTLCAHCGRANETVRDLCWACFKPLKDAATPAPGQPFQLIFEGRTYTSGDPQTPHDVQMLMDRIGEEGYSEDLLREWVEWRATRVSDAHYATVFQGQRVSVLRIDGQVYQSDRKDLSPEIREIFDYVQRHGVTPELLEHLRMHGETVKFRPETTQKPSDGDIEFWGTVARGYRPRQQRTEELLWARIQAGWLTLIIAVVVGAVLVWFYRSYVDFIQKI